MKSRDLVTPFLCSSREIRRARFPLLVSNYYFPNHDLMYFKNFEEAVIEAVIEGQFWGPNRTPDTPDVPDSSS